MKIFPPLMLILWISTLAIAQQTPPSVTNWPYEVLHAGQGPKLSRNQAAETHNQLVALNGQVLVSTYQIGVPDYQLISDLSTPFQAACEVMQEGGKYRFQIPMAEFKSAVKGADRLSLPGDHVIWEVELVKILPPLPDIASKVKASIQKDGADEAFRLFRVLRAGRDEQVYFGEWEVNEVGYIFLNMGKNAEAIEVFRYNTEHRPNSANTHDSLAEAYLKAGQTEMAAAHYRRSLELNPGNDNARKMLKSIER